jgi:hypothetical protein
MTADFPNNSHHFTSVEYEKNNITSHILSLGSRWKWEGRLTTRPLNPREQATSTYWIEGWRHEIWQSFLSSCESICHFSTHTHTHRPKLIRPAVSRINYDYGPGNSSCEADREIHLKIYYSFLNSQALKPILTYSNLATHSRSILLISSLLLHFHLQWSIIRLLRIVA